MQSLPLEGEAAGVSQILTAGRNQDGFNEPLGRGRESASPNKDNEADVKLATYLLIQNTKIHSDSELG